MDADNEVDPETGLTRKQIERYLLRKEALALAWASPLPGSLGAAFAPAATDLCGFRLRPVTLGDICLLIQLEHPLIQALTSRLAREDIESGPTTFGMNEEHIAAALFIWTIPCAEATTLFRWSAAKFKNKAGEALGLRTPDGLERMARGLYSHLLGAFETSLAMKVTSNATFFGQRSDGFGWWLPILGMMLRDYGMTMAYALNELPLVQAFPLMALAQWKEGMEFDGDSYIGQERERREEAKEAAKEAGVSPGGESDSANAREVSSAK